MWLQYLNEKTGWRVRWFIALLIAPFGFSSLLQAFAPYFLNVWGGN